MSRILAPVDFSGCADAALAHALDLAQRFEAEVIALHVYESPAAIADVMVQGVSGRPVTMLEFTRQRAERLMTQAIEALDADVPTSWQLEAGDADDVIPEVASREEVDLVVMGTHGRRGLSHLLLGSVAERVIRRAPCPVLVVRDHYPEAPQ